MGVRITGRQSAAMVGIVGAALFLGACGGSSGGGTAAGSGSKACADYKQYGKHDGKTVTIQTSIVAPEDTAQIDSYKQFEACTGIKVNYQGDKSFEAQILVRAKAGNPPDLAIVPQPGLLKQLVATGKAVEAPQAVSDNVDKFWGEDWKGLATVDGKFYSAPLGANVKSFVWYSPKMFQEGGYTIPKTLDELKALSDKIASDGDVKPWCAGIGSDAATGWPVTDWMEDMMLRLYGPDVYDQWVNHEIPFNGAESTTFQDGGQPILQGQCYMHRQASFYAANWPEGTDVSENGDVFAFYFPSKDETAKPVLGGGEFILAFNNKPEVQAFQTFLSSDTWANAKADATPNGGWVSANKGLDPAKLKSPIDKLSATILADPKAVFRFDGSDQMPAAVGSNSFWKGATDWITGQSTKATVDKIEKSWPAS
jgi:alpha-glucoside transport system substrate-binding protein